MTGTLRRRRSRNPYREVLLTYCRWRFLLNAVVCVPFYALALQASFARLMDFAILSFGALFIPMPLVGHLKEIFSSPRARLTPGLFRAHLIVAAAWTLYFVAFVPIGLSLFMLDASGQQFARVAVCFALFAVGCFLSQAPGLAFFLIYLLLALSNFRDFQIARSLSWFESVGLCAVSVLLVISAGVRVAHVDAEHTVSTEDWLLQRAGRLTAQLIFFVRLQLRSSAFAFRRVLVRRGRAVDADGGEELRQVPPSRAASRRLRALGGGTPGPSEGVWRRARHLDAAWQFSGKSTLLGAITGGVFIALDLRSARPDFQPCALLVGSLPIVALYFGVFLVNGESWSRLAVEFLLRPFSRVQFVQAAGLAIIVALARFILLAVAVPGATLWLRGGFSLTGGAFWWAVAVIAWLLLFLAIGLADLPAFEATFWAIICLVAYSIFLIVCAADADGMNPYPLGVLSAVLLVVGLLSLRGACRTWLDRDPDEGRIS